MGYRYRSLYNQSESCVSILGRKSHFQWVSVRVVPFHPFCLWIVCLGVAGVDESVRFVGLLFADDVILFASSDCDL